IVKQRLEASLRQIVERRGGTRMTKQRLRSHHDERLARIVLHLTAQSVEVLRRRRRIHDLHVPLGAQREETLETRARMLRALSFITVRKQKDQSAVLSPFLFRAGDKLIDHDLRAVDEVAEL